MGGDELAWFELVTRVRPELRQIALRSIDQPLARRVDPSDVVQESLLEAWTARRSFHGSSEHIFRAWARRILERNVRDTIRKHVYAGKRALDVEQWQEEAGSGSRQRTTEPVDPGLSPRTAFFRHEELQALLSYVEELPGPQRQAVELRYYDRCSLSEIAKRMSISENAVAQLIFRAVCRIRRLHDIDDSN